MNQVKFHPEKKWEDFVGAFAIHKFQNVVKTEPTTSATTYVLMYSFKGETLKMNSRKTKWGWLNQFGRLPPN